MMPARSNGLLGTVFAQRGAAVYMEVQMLRILIPTQVGQDPASSSLTFIPACAFHNTRQYFVQKGLVRTAEVDQRRDMPLWDNNDVHWPERARMTKGKHLIRLGNDLDRRPAVKCLVAIEIFAHRSSNGPN